MRRTITNEQGEKLAYKFHKAEIRRKLRKDERPPLLVIGHGITGNYERPFIKALANSACQCGISVLRFDFSGHGESEGKFGDATISKEVEDLRAVVNAADEAGFSIHYAGHSMGAAVGILLAAEDERIRHLVGLASMIHTRRFVDAEFGEVTPGKGNMWGEAGCRLTNAFVDDLKSIDTVLPRMQELEIPILLVHGGADDVIPQPEARAAYDFAKEPKQLITIPKADHVFSGNTAEIMVFVTISWLCDRLALPKPRRALLNALLAHQKPAPPPARKPLAPARKSTGTKAKAAAPTSKTATAPSGTKSVAGTTAKDSTPAKASGANTAKASAKPKASPARKADAGKAETESKAPTPAASPTKAKSKPAAAGTAGKPKAKAAAKAKPTGTAAAKPKAKAPANAKSKTSTKSTGKTTKESAEKSKGKPKATAKPEAKAKAKAKAKDERKPKAKSASSAAPGKSSASRTRAVARKEKRAVKSTKGAKATTAPRAAARARSAASPKTTPKPPKGKAKTNAKAGSKAGGGVRSSGSRKTSSKKA